MRFEYTVTAKTVDEAYRKAIDLYSSLGETSMEEVISRGKKGFLDRQKPLFASYMSLTCLRKA